jgi:hypothetical protein
MSDVNITVTATGVTISLNTVTPSGPAGGDLGGVFPNPTVDGLQTRPVSATAPTTSQVLAWSGSAWTPTTITTSGIAGGDLSGTYPNPNVIALTVEVSNHTGVSIPKGAAVFISSAAGQIPRITLAQANAYSTTDALGLTTTSIAHGATGRVIISGLLTDVDTDAFADGDVLYLSAAVAGELTNTEPVRPNWQVQIGYCAYSHQNHGKIVVVPHLESTKTEYITDMTSAGETLATLAPLAEGSVIGRLPGVGAGDPQNIPLAYGITGLSDIGVSLSYLIDTLAVPVTMTSANVWYSGPTVTLTAGTWLVAGQVLIDKGANSTTLSFAYRISTGSTHYASGEQAWNTRTGAIGNGSLSTIITVAASTQIWMQASSQYANGSIRIANAFNPSGNNASQLIAVRLA